MTNRTTLHAAALALVLLVPTAASAQTPLSDSEIELLTANARGEFITSALEDGLEGDAVDIVFRLEVASAPILELASSVCPIMVHVNNVTDAPMFGASFEIGQSFERSGIPTEGGTTTHLEIPIVPPRTRVRARIECVEPPSSVLWGTGYGPPVSRTVQFSTFGDVYGLEDEGLHAMAEGQAAFSTEYGTYTPGRSIHSLLWHVVDDTEIGAPFEALVTRLMASADGRATLFRYLADVPNGPRGQSIASAVADLPAAQLGEVYGSLPVDVAGQALSMLDDAAYTRTERALRRTPEGRAAILSLLGVTDRADRFAAIAATVDDENLDSALIALAAGSYLEEQRTTLFDQLSVRAHTLPPERQSALAVTLFTRWLDHRVPSLAIESRIPALRDLGRTEVDALVRQRASDADTLFAYGALPESMDALELYRLVTTDLADCASTQARLASCADTIDASPALLGATQRGLQPSFLARAQTTLSTSLDADTAAIAHRWQAWGLDLTPIIAAACAGAQPYSYSYDPEAMRAYAAALDPDAYCLREIAEREASERASQTVRFGMGCLGLVLVILGVYFFGRRGLAHLHTVRLEDAKAHPAEEGGRIEKRIAPEIFATSFTRGLRGTEAAIEGEGTPESAEVVKALAGLKPHERELAETARELAREVVAHGEVRSELIELGGITVYLVVVPGMHDQPQAFRRHEAFSHGWLAHVDRLKSMLARSKLPSRLLTLFLFVRPDGTETALLVALEDGSTRYLPFGLLDEQEVHAKVGRQGTHREQWSATEGSV